MREIRCIYMHTLQSHRISHAGRDQVLAPTLRAKKCPGWGQGAAKVQDAKCLTDRQNRGQRHRLVAPTTTRAVWKSGALPGALRAWKKPSPRLTSDFSACRSAASH